jgi:hypothetical protein
VGASAAGGGVELQQHGKAGHNYVSAFQIQIRHWPL